ncbi:MAG TPA: O-antigen ligase family protein [Chthoniobacterales bacterium]
MPHSDTPTRSSSVSHADTPTRRHADTLFLRWFVTGIALSAALLGGDTAKWGEALPLIGIGLLAFFAPVKALPNRIVSLGVMGLLLCGLVSFMPVRWFGEPAWHAAVHEAVPGLTRTVSLQPWQSLKGFGLMFAATFFGVWLIQWRPPDRTASLQLLPVGIAALALVSLAAHFRGVAVPGWQPSQGFGPLPNRNQTGSLMALGAILALAFMARAIRKRDWRAPLWSCVFLLCLTAVLLANSRASLCLLALGTVCWLLQRLKLSLKGLALAGGMMALIAAVALSMGASLVSRMPELVANGLGFRGKIYQDTFRLVASAPLQGVGLGNFGVLFPLVRDHSLSLERVIHPESDWLWLASEMGLPAVLCCGVAIAGLLTRPVRATTRGEKDVLVAGMIGVSAFLGHSVIDVPGHRLGTVLPLMLVAANCTRSTLLADGGKWIPRLSRLLGVGLVLFGLFLAREKAAAAELRQVLMAGDWEAVERTASQALVRTPLDWFLHEARGWAQVREHRWLEALGEFRCVDTLEPKLARVSFDEGRAWIGASSSLVMVFWTDALGRSLPSERPGLYAEMLSAAWPVSSLHEAVLRLADADAELALVAVQSGHSDARTLEGLETGGFSLDPEQQRIVALAKARELAAKQEFQEAYEIARRNLRPVPYPARSHSSENECRAALAVNPDDFAAAFNLTSILRSEGREPEALKVLTAITKMPGCPVYFNVMTSDISAAMDNWPQAWAALGGLVR